jgi:hypothetical protein
MAFSAWTDRLEKRPAPEHDDLMIVHEEYPSGKEFDIAKEAKDSREDAVVSRALAGEAT